MAKKVSRSSGSIVLELAIAFLAVVLILAILYPKKLWNEQAHKEEICRARMENLYFATRFYNRTSKQHTDNIPEILEFAHRESLDVHPAGFRMDRLTTLASGKDSFLVDYFDPYQLFSHFEKAIDFSWHGGRDSIVLTIVPLSMFDLLPSTRYIFAANQAINARTDDRGDQGVFTLVGSQGAMRGQQILGETIRVPADKYIFKIPPDNIDVCPETGSHYRMWVNVRLNLRAEMIAGFQQDSSSKQLSDSKLLSSIAVFRLLKEADGKATRTLVENRILETVEDSLINLRNEEFLAATDDELRREGFDALADAIHDSLLENHSLEDSEQVRWETIRDSSYNFMNQLKEGAQFARLRDSIVNKRKNILAEENFVEAIEKINNEKKISLLETGTISTTADSVAYYSKVELIKGRLFKQHSDKVTTSYLARPEVTEMLSRFYYTDYYRVVRVDSTGTTITCPIEGEYKKKNPSVLERIFGVRGTENHGNVTNGDLSWSERR